MRALITGISGQDGQWLAEQLLARGYQVHGMLRGQDASRAEQLEEAYPGLSIVYGDMLDEYSLAEAVWEAKPQEIYNMAAISLVSTSWHSPELVMDVNALGVLRLLQVVRDYGPHIKVLQASSSEMFGGGEDLNEASPMYPRSVYGVSKLAAHHICHVFRNSYNMHISTAISFNHESEKRGIEFVTRKIIRHAVRYKLGLTKEPLSLGNIHARRDWGYAPDYTHAMQLILDYNKSEDFVLGTGIARSVEELYRTVCRIVGVEVPCRIVPSDRPWDVDVLSADASKARNLLGWQPQTSFDDMIAKMVAEEYRLQRQACEPTRV